MSRSWRQRTQKVQAAIRAEETMEESANWGAFEDVVKTIVGPVTKETIALVSEKSEQIRDELDQVNGSVGRAEASLSSQSRSLKDLKRTLEEAAYVLDTVRSAVDALAQESMDGSTKTHAAFAQFGEELAARCAEHNQLAAMIAETRDGLESNAARLDDIWRSVHDSRQMNDQMFTQMRSIIQDGGEQRRTELLWATISIGSALVITILMIAALWLRL